MKFEDIEFKPHAALKGFEALSISNYELFSEWKSAKHAVIHFPNGFGVSIVFGKLFYSNGIDTYEVAILHNGAITYKTWITNDVMGYLSKDELMYIVNEVERLCNENNGKPYICLAIQSIRILWSYKVAPFFKWLYVHKIQRYTSWIYSYFRSSK